MPVDPETVVVFDVGVLSTLDSLGVDIAGVPDAVFPEVLAQYGEDEYPKVGSLFEPDYEAVNALEPDLIIVAGRSAAAYPELAEIAPTVDLTVDNGDFVASFEQRVTSLAEIFGAEEEVADRLAALDERIGDVQEAAQNAGNALFVMTSASELSAYGPGTRFGFVYNELGLTAADDELTAADHGDAVSFEYLAETDPDLLFVLDRTRRSVSPGRRRSRSSTTSSSTGRRPGRTTTSTTWTPPSGTSPQTVCRRSSRWSRRSRPRWSEQDSFPDSPGRCAAPAHRTGPAAARRRRIRLAVHRRERPDPARPARP